MVLFNRLFKKMMDFPMIFVCRMTLQHLPATLHDGIAGDNRENLIVPIDAKVFIYCTAAIDYLFIKIGFTLIQLLYSILKGLSNLLSALKTMDFTLNNS